MAVEAMPSKKDLAPFSTWRYINTAAQAISLTCIKGENHHEISA
jgi:hypothetical protein